MESSGLAVISDSSASTFHTETVLLSQSAAFFTTDAVLYPLESQADDGVGLSGASVGGPALVLGVSMSILCGLVILGLLLLLVLRRKRSEWDESLDDPFGDPFPGEADVQTVGKESLEVFDDDYENPLSGERGVDSLDDAFHFAQGE
jgi:hypothetical protein